MKILLLIFVQIIAYAAAKEHMFYSLSKRSDQSQPMESNPRLPKALSHHLRWITEQTVFPVRLTVPKANESSAAKLTWKRLSDGKSGVEMLDSTPHSYILTENATTSSLYLIKYDVKSNEQLASYEPVAAAAQSSPEDADKPERNVFSLVHLKEHKVSVEKVLNKHKISCVADFLVSKAERELIEPIMKLMEKQASFKLAVQAPGKFVVPGQGELRRGKGQSQEHLPPQSAAQQPMLTPEMIQQANQVAHEHFGLPQQHLQPQPVQQPAQQYSPLPVLIHDENHYTHPAPHQQQYHQQPPMPMAPPMQPQMQMAPPMPMAPPMQPPVQMAPPHPVYYSQQQPPVVYQQPMYPAPPQQPMQQARPQTHHPLDDAFNMLVSAAFEKHQRKQMNPNFQSVQQHQQQIFDYLQSPYFYAPHIIPQASYLTPAPYTTFSHMKRKRDAVESDLDKLSGEPEPDFDTERFVKVRLSLGPVTLFRPLLSNEIVSCSLDLINLDGHGLDYSSTIFANMSAYSPEAEAARQPAKQMKKINKGIINIAIDKKMDTPAIVPQQPQPQQQLHQQMQQPQQQQMQQPQQPQFAPTSFDELRQTIMAPITNDLNEIKSFLKSQDLHQKLQQQAHSRLAEKLIEAKKEAESSTALPSPSPVQESLKMDQDTLAQSKGLSSAAFVSAQSIASVMIIAVSVIFFNSVF